MNRLLILLVPLLLLAGCESGGPREPDAAPGAATPATATGDVQDLLAAASLASPPRSTSLTLDAAEAALVAGNVDQARRILDLVDTSGYRELAKRHIYLAARVAIGDNDPARALALLEDERLRGTTLTERDQIAIGKIRAQAYHAGRSYLASARERIFIHKLLDEDEKARNHELIFASLMELPADTLVDQANKAITSDLRGWLSLAAMTKRYQNDPLQQLVELNKWKKIWSHHPAASQLPASLRLLSQVVDAQPESVAVLLPLRGELGPYGRAIRDGILAAHYGSSNRSRIRVYDTTTEDVVALLRVAQRDGAELAIGPLSRENVTRLAASGKLPVPVLALNRTIDNSVNADLYQFGLAPEDEVRQVARQAFEEGKRDALVLYPVGDWGERTFGTFEQEWLSLGGNIVDAAAFENRADYSDLVKSLLDVDESESRATELRRIIGKRFEFTPRRRQDIDFIVLLADPAQARRLNPTLAFYYAEDIPVYATSHVHEQSDSKIDAIDLNGIRFCDIPWKLAETDGLQQRIETAWPSATRALGAFYALGVDAYRLYPRLQQLKEIPDAKLFGATGVLNLGPGNVVTRRLMWARFQDGEAISMPMIVEAAGG